MSDSKLNPLTKSSELTKTITTKAEPPAVVEAETTDVVDTSNKTTAATTTITAAAAETDSEAVDLQGATAIPLAGRNSDSRASIVLVNAANSGSEEAAQEIGVILNMSANDTVNETVNVSEFGAKIYAVINNTPNAAVDNESERSCWICFATDEDNRLAAWVQPCKCRGTTKWVHQSCLYRWIDEKQKGNALRTVSCQQCQTEYIIVFPHMGKFANILESFDNLIKRLSPFLAAGIIVGSLYWTAVTYGAVTFLQIVGHKKGLTIMENGDPLILLLGLPAIPVGLVLGRMIRWEDAILRIIRNRRSVARKLPLMNFIIPYPEEEEEQTAQNPATPTLSDPVSATRVFCGALLLPTISCIVGRLLFESIDNTLHRTLLGGLTFITVKGILKIYLKQQQYSRKKKRRIIDYTEDNVRAYVHLSGSNNARHFITGNTAAAAAAAAMARQQAVPQQQPQQQPPNVNEHDFMV